MWGVHRSVLMVQWPVAPCSKVFRVDDKLYDNLSHGAWSPFHTFQEDRLASSQRSKQWPLPTTVMCAATWEWPCSSADRHFISVPHRTENTYTLSCVPFTTPKSQILRTASLSLGVVRYTCNPSTEGDHEYCWASRSCDRVKPDLRIKAQMWRSLSKTPSRSSGSIHAFPYLCRAELCRALKRCQKPHNSCCLLEARIEIRAGAASGGKAETLFTWFDDTLVLEQCKHFFVFRLDTLTS